MLAVAVDGHRRSSPTPFRRGRRWTTAKNPRPLPPPCPTPFRRGRRWTTAKNPLSSSSSPVPDTSPYRSACHRSPSRCRRRRRLQRQRWWPACCRVTESTAIKYGFASVNGVRCATNSAGHSTVRRAWPTAILATRRRPPTAVGECCYRRRCSLPSIPSSVAHERLSVILVFVFLLRTIVAYYTHPHADAHTEIGSVAHPVVVHFVSTYGLDLH